MQSNDCCLYSNEDNDKRPFDLKYSQEQGYPSSNIVGTDNQKRCKMEDNTPHQACTYNMHDTTLEEQWYNESKDGKYMDLGELDLQGVMETQFIMKIIT